MFDRLFIYTITAAELQKSNDIELAEGQEYYWALVEIQGRAYKCEIVGCSVAQRWGVCTNANAQWVDAKTPEEALAVVFAPFCPSPMRRDLAGLADLEERIELEQSEADTRTGYEDTRNIRPPVNAPWDTATSGAHYVDRQGASERYAPCAANRRSPQTRDFTGEYFSNWPSWW
jgi:hypothetical protein